MYAIPTISVVLLPVATSIPRVVGEFAHQFVVGTGKQVPLTSDPPRATSIPCSNRSLCCYAAAVVGPVATLIQNVVGENASHFHANVAATIALKQVLNVAVEPVTRVPVHVVETNFLGRAATLQVCVFRTIWEVEIAIVFLLLLS